MHYQTLAKSLFELMRSAVSFFFDMPCSTIVWIQNEHCMCRLYLH